MKNALAILSATTILTLAAGVFAADESVKGESKVEYKKDGGYESTQSSKRTSAEGTTSASETNVDVDVDSKGQVSKTVTTEASTDPEGLLNKTKDTAKTKVEEKDRGGYEQTTTRKHKDAAGTNVTDKTTTDVDVDKEGNVTQVVKTEKRVDPKGLMNEKVTKTETKTVNGQIVEQKKESSN